MFTLTHEDRSELRHLAASIKFGVKLSLSVVAVACALCVVAPMPGMGGGMIGTVLDAIWGK